MFLEAGTAEDVMAKARFLAPVIIHEDQEADAFGKIAKGDYQGAVDIYGADQSMALVGIIEHQGHFTALFASQSGGVPAVSVTQFRNGELHIVSKQMTGLALPVKESIDNAHLIGASVMRGPSADRVSFYFPQAGQTGVIDADSGQNPRPLTADRDVLFAAVHRYNFPHLHEEDFAKVNPFDRQTGGSDDADPKENELYIPTSDDDGNPITVKRVGHDGQLSTYPNTVTHEHLGKTFFKFIRNESLWSPQPSEARVGVDADADTKTSLQADPKSSKWGWLPRLGR